MRHNQKKHVKMVILSFAYTLIFVIVYALAGAKPVQMALDEIKHIWIVSAPSLVYENGTQKEGYIPTVGEQYGELVCEEIGLRAPLYYGDSEKELQLGLGTYLGGGIPGEEKVTLLGGHDTTFLKPLEKIKNGQEIFVKTVYGTYSYVVTGTEVKKVNQFQLNVIEAETDLVLYTCYPFGTIDQNREERFFVYVKEQ